MPETKSYDPFVCKKTPLVGRNDPPDRPIILISRPFVGCSENTPGFTLIELLVTLAVAAVLMVLAGPSFSTFIANQRISGQTNDLLSDMNYARSEAVKRSAPVTVCKTANPNVATPVCDATDANRWTAGRLIFRDDNGDGDLDAGEEILRIRQAIEGSGNLIMGFGDSDGTANRITFFGDGRSHLTAQGELLSCDVRGDAYGLAVAIQTTGRARTTSRGKDKDGNDITACP